MTRAALATARPATDAVRRALEGAGLGDWSAICRPLEEAAAWVVVLTSPEYDPAARPPRGKLFAARAPGEWEGLSTAIARAVAGSLQ